MELPERILQVLDTSKDLTLESLSLADKLSVDHQKIVGGIKSLEAYSEELKSKVINSESYVIKKWQLTSEGEQIAKNGSHEALVFAQVPAEGIPQPDLMKAVGAVGKIGFSKAMSAGWIMIDKSGGKPLVKRKVESIEDKVKEHMNLVSQGKIDEVKLSVRFFKQ